MRFSSTILLSIFNCLVAQYALCSNSTGKWHAFPNTSLNGNIPNGVLNAVLHTQSASSVFLAQSFFELLTVFSKIDLISLFDTSAWPLVCGWYAVRSDAGHHIFSTRCQQVCYRKCSSICDQCPCSSELGEYMTVEKACYPTLASLVC